MPYGAPYQLTSGQLPLPAGEFEFTITTTRERLVEMLGVLMAGEMLDMEPLGDHNIDVIEALANWDTCEGSP